MKEVSVQYLVAQIVAKTDKIIADTDIQIALSKKLLKDMSCKYTKIDIAKTDLQECTKMIQEMRDIQKILENTPKDEIDLILTAVSGLFLEENSDTAHTDAPIINCPEKYDTLCV